MDEANKAGTIAFYASSFCYGPASIGLAIAAAIREARTSNVRLHAFGDGTAFEMFQDAPTIDQSHRWSWPTSGQPTKRSLRVFDEADLTVSLGDFEFAEAMFKAGIPVVVVDPLYWMWDEDPIPVDHCLEYFAPDFAGLRERIADYRGSNPELRMPRVVDPVFDALTMDEIEVARQRDMLLVNFGGLESPMGDNYPLALAMARCIVDVALDLGSYETVRIRGGGGAIRRIAAELADADPRVVVGSLEQKQFFRELATCRDFVTVPGLSIIYEAAHFGRKTLLTLPLNYSQHRQGAVYQRALKDIHFVQWDDLREYETLPPHLPEAEGMASARALGERFAEDPGSQDRFKYLVREFLLSPTTSIDFADGGTNLARKDGAQQLAEALLDLLPTSRVRPPWPSLVIE